MIIEGEERMDKIAEAFSKACARWEYADWDDPEQVLKIAQALGDLELHAYDLQSSVATEVQRLREAMRS